MPRFNLDEYITVQDRITRFWQDYPAGRIITDLCSPEDNFQQVRYKASIYTDSDDMNPRATGYAFELAQTSGQGPNTTSHEENCETSAIGRALANLGYATSQKDRPSREEMRKVNAGPPPAPRQHPGADKYTEHYTQLTELCEDDDALRNAWRWMGPLWKGWPEYDDLRGAMIRRHDALTAARVEQMSPE